jgi:AcrR family transcriptional regulator
MDGTPLSGRKAQAARNDGTILDAARTVFVRDPGAPISAVAAEAGVGISALYRRYASKQELLVVLCTDGLNRYLAIASEALTTKDPWESFAGFLRGIVEADVHSLTVQLAGTFTPTDELRKLADESGVLTTKLLRRAKTAHAVRADLDVNDLPMLFEQLSAVRGDDPARTLALRRRYLALMLDSLRPEAASAKLPGRPPTPAELGARWIPRCPAGRRRASAEAMAAMW